jgi:branched-subunit amino acid transport protein
MSAMWWGVIGTSVAAFALKLLGHSIPQKFLDHPKIQRTNLLVPITLLSALVATQTFTEKRRLVFDHRAAGLIVAVIALKFRAPFPVVVILAALTSALVYHFS